MRRPRFALKPLLFDLFRAFPANELNAATNLRHIQPVHQGGDVYDIDSLIVAMTDEEILTLIGRLLRGEGSDEEFGEWVEQLKTATRCPHFLRLLREANADTAPQEILERARQYKPIQL